MTDQQPTGDQICPRCHQYLAICTCKGATTKGWECPRCGKVWAPEIIGCTCKPLDVKTEIEVI